MHALLTCLEINESKHVMYCSAGGTNKKGTKEEKQPLTTLENTAKLLTDLDIVI